MPHIAPGSYRATALEAVLSMSSTGKEMINVEFRLADSTDQITWRGFFTDKTKDRTIESLRYCGWTGDDIGNVTFPQGNEVILVIEEETYEGKTHSRVQWVNRASKGPVVKNEMSLNDRKAFAAKMKGAILAFDAKNPDAKGGGDDIPF